MTRPRAPAAVAFLMLASAGCFDVHMVDLGPFVLDDFDDGDLHPNRLYPNDVAFGDWGCRMFNASADQTCSPGLDDGDGSPFGLALRVAAISDPADGINQDEGAGLITAALTPLDFTPFGSIGFDAKVERGDPPISGDATLNVRIGCDTAATTGGDVPGGLYVTQQVDLPPAWEPLSVELRTFGPPPSATALIKGGTPACLRQVSNVQFVVETGLDDGQSGTFTLVIDGITFR